MSRRNGAFVGCAHIPAYGVFTERVPAYDVFDERVPAY